MLQQFFETVGMFACYGGLTIMSCWLTSVVTVWAKKKLNFARANKVLLREIETLRARIQYLEEHADDEPSTKRSQR